MARGGPAARRRRVGRRGRRLGRRAPLPRPRCLRWGGRVLGLRRARRARPRTWSSRGAGLDRRVRAPRPVEARQPRLPGERGQPRALPITRLPRGRRLPTAREARRRVARRRHRRALARRGQLTLSRPLGSLLDLDDDERAGGRPLAVLRVLRTQELERAVVAARQRVHGRAAAPTRAASSRRRSGR